MPSPGASTRTRAPRSRLVARTSLSLVSAAAAAVVTGTAWQPPPANVAAAKVAPPKAKPAAPAAVTAQAAPAPAAAPAAAPQPALAFDAQQPVRLALGTPPPPQGEAALAAAEILRKLHATSNGDQYFAGLRAQVRWVKVRVGDREVPTLDAGSRLLLAQSAAQRARLGDVGLDFRDVYGVINAETSWLPRTGQGRNGVTSFGLAQFEPATARAVGLRNPNDPVEAVHAAAVLLKEAATWSARRIASLELSPEMRAAKLREGISIYYNLSSRARALWKGTNTQHLPVETLRHIENVRTGAELAEKLQTGNADGPAGPVVAPPAAMLAVPAPAPAPAPALTRVITVTRASGRAAGPARVLRQAGRGSARQLAHGKGGRVASTNDAVTVAGVHPIEIAERDGRKTWVLPWGTISWSGQAGS